MDNKNFTPHFIYRHLVRYDTAQVRIDKLNFIEYLSGRRTTISLLISKEFNYEGISSIDNIPLSSILQPVIGLSNIAGNV